MSNTYALEGQDTSAVGRAPNVVFELHYGESFSADPPGGHIFCEVLDDDCAKCRIKLTDTTTGELVANIVSTHVEPRDPESIWNNKLAHHAEIAAALYWSMWRMQQLRAMQPVGEVGDG